VPDEVLQALLVLGEHVAGKMAKLAVVPEMF
jgi:hypothetical protein